MKPVSVLSTARVTSRTKVVGVSYVESLNGRTRTGSPRRYFSAHTRKWDGAAGIWRAVNRKFCLNTLGKQEAWRRAVRFRAEFERFVGAGQFAGRSAQ